VAPEEEGNDKVMQYFGITAGDVPTAAIVNMAGSGMKKFMLPAGDVSEAALKDFAAQYAAGALKPSLKSEKPTKDKDDVRVLVGENFDELVLQGPEEVALVEFYAPWCGHCKNLAPEWASAAEQTAGENVRFGAVDADAHRELGARFGVKGFPTIKTFAQGAKKDSEARFQLAIAAAAEVSEAKPPGCETPPVYAAQRFF
jgi:protein disulfide-isomerase-like protein